MGRGDQGRRYQGERVAPLKRIPAVLSHVLGVMAGLVPAIYVLLAPLFYHPHAGEGREGEDVDARDKRGHDDGRAAYSAACMKIEFS
jgi:hypothetical protein